MIKKAYIAIIGFIGVLLAAGCTGDLDQKPVIGDNATAVYSTIDGYKSVLAKIYGSYSLIGQERAGNPDLSSNKGQDLLRNLFNKNHRGRCRRPCDKRPDPRNPRPSQY